MSEQVMQLIYAAAALAGLTIFVYFALTVVGVIGNRSGALSKDYALTRDGTPPPAWIGNIGRNLNNLFEFPVLFYVLVIFHALAPGTVDGAQVSLAWAFVGLRFAHTLIHTTVNSLLLRFSTHRISVIVLAVMWVRFVLALHGAGA